MTSEAMAALHARCFIRPRPWTADEFRALASGAGVFVLSDPQGFLLGRAVVDEAELLTLAVDPAARRQGAGRALVERFLRAAADRGAAQAFLEVAADNAPARALYLSTGWSEAGARRGYYGGTDAIVMRHPLG